MKVISAPWIRCRADEVDAIPSTLEWRGRSFKLLAYSEKEAFEWWRGLSDHEREALLGLNGENAGDGPGLF